MKDTRSDPPGESVSHPTQDWTALLAMVRSATEREQLIASLGRIARGASESSDVLEAGFLLPVGSSKGEADEHEELAFVSIGGLADSATRERDCIGRPEELNWAQQSRAPFSVPLGQASKEARAITAVDNPEACISLFPVVLKGKVVAAMFLVHEGLDESAIGDHLERIHSASASCLEGARHLEELSQEAHRLLLSHARETKKLRQLKRTKEFLEHVIDSSVDGIISADLKGKVLIYNRAAARIFDYEREEVVGKVSVGAFYPPGVARDIMRRIKSREGGGPGKLEGFRVEMLNKSGQRVPVNLSASLVLDGETPIGTVGIFTDIREKLAMESSLAEAQRLLQDRQRKDAIAEVAGAAAHELNQPLTSVMGYAEYLKRAVAGDARMSHAVEVILTETSRMADIIRKVGKITRYETKPYVGGAKIVDLERASSDLNPDQQETDDASD